MCDTPHTAPHRDIRSTHRSTHSHTVTGRLLLQCTEWDTTTDTRCLSATTTCLLVCSTQHISRHVTQRSTRTGRHADMRGMTHSERSSSRHTVSAPCMHGSARTAAGQQSPALIHSNSRTGSSTCGRRSTRRHVRTTAGRPHRRSASLSHSHTDAHTSSPSITQQPHSGGHRPSTSPLSPTCLLQ